MPRRRGSDSSSVSPSRDGDERVLEAGAAAVVRVDVAGGDAGDPEPLGEPRRASGCGRGRGASRAAAARPGSGRARRRRAAAGRAAPPRRVLPRSQRTGDRPVPGAAGEADQPLGVLLDLLQRHPRLLG